VNATVACPLPAVAVPMTGAPGAVAAGPFTVSVNVCVTGVPATPSGDALSVNVWVPTSDAVGVPDSTPSLLTDSQGTSELFWLTERRVAELAATGLTNRQAAEALFVTVKTVETHLARVYQKLGISTRTELLHPSARSAAKAGR
jgi:DNA-binding NarL/FixJ family response regulator